MGNEKTLTEKEILNKKFPKDIKGYDAAEVDLFLDQIIKDYGTFQKEISAMNAEILSLKGKLHQIEQANAKPDVVALRKRIHALELENASMKNKLVGIQEGDKVSSENMEYIKRIRMLENFIWQLGFDPKTLRKRNS
jgi:DivIVA domain-containing protein